ncbi:MAG: type II secretion system secretin GspD [Nitrospirae bacterium]|nr:type II secretion system secretin GspD [Nitrospirota bacterium]
MNRKKSYIILHPSSFILLFIFLSSFIIHPSSFLAGPVYAGVEKGQGKDKKVAVNFVDVDISTVVKFISEVTGKNFVFDDKVKGNVTIIAPSKLSVDEAFSLFTSVLELKGFTIILSGKIYKIVPISQAKQSGTEILTEFLKDNGSQVSDAYITKLIQLKSISSEKALNFLQPLISRDGHISSYGPGNMIMIVDSATNIEKVLKIVETIDKPGAEEPELILLKYANAEDVVKILGEALSLSRAYQPAAPRIPRPGEAVGTVSIEETKAHVFADSRLNAIILFAGKQERDTVNRMISLLDIPLPEATSKINVYFLEYADATELANVIDGLLKAMQQRGQPAAGTAPSAPFEAAWGITITPDRATNSLVIVASPADYQNLLHVIRQLDKRSRQVFVEAMITEVSIDKLLELGAKWRGTVTKDGEPIFIGGFGRVEPTTIESIITGLTGLTMGGVGNYLTIPKDFIPGATTDVTTPGLAALFNLSELRGAVNVLSTPQILTSDNKEAEIVVGENVPFISRREADPTRPAVLFHTIERKDVGITLRIVPQITEGDYVKLDIYQEISSVRPEPVEVLINVGPTTTKRSTKTSVAVKDGQTVVIGGLMQERDEESVSKVPVLGDIPLLGWLFKYKKAEKKKTNLLVFLTPHIVKEAERLAQITEHKHKEFARMEGQYVEGELLVKFKDGITDDRALTVISEKGASVIKFVENINVYHIRLRKGQPVEDAVKEFSEMPEVQYAEPNYIRKIQSTK